MVRIQSGDLKPSKLYTSPTYIELELLTQHEYWIMWEVLEMKKAYTSYFN